MKEFDLLQTVSRIETMEAYFDVLQSAVNLAPETLRETSMIQKLQALTQYYEGGQWLQDFQLDEAGLLPEKLKRGVLSEDGVYDLLAQIVAVI